MVVLHSALACGFLVFLLLSASLRQLVFPALDVYKTFYSYVRVLYI